MDFAKLHGLGNDFLVVSVHDRPTTRPMSDIARVSCDRHCGIGADGILFYQPTAGDSEADFSALIFNADGSRAEMSGNGVRCLAAWLIHNGECTSEAPRIRTVSGIKRLSLLRREGFRYYFDCSMGEPIMEPSRVPVRLTVAKGPILDYPLEVGTGSVRVSILSMGNPHCSTFWPELSDAPIDSLGPLLENHPCFANRANVEFIQVLDSHRIRVKFWERGVGRTLASGTGSSAAAAVSILRGLVESPVTVETEMGVLSVDWRPGRELMLSGPAEFVCTGNFPAVSLDG